MNWSVPSVCMYGPASRRERWDAAGAVEQAASSRGEATILRIDGSSSDHAAHLELAVLDGEGEAALDEIERVLAELLVAPAVRGY